MATFVRVQEIEHDIGAQGRFVLRVTNQDVELRAVDGSVARVRVEFELRASSDAEADAAMSAVQFGVERGDGMLEVSEPRRGDGGPIARVLGATRVRAEARVVAEVPADAAVAYAGVSADFVGRGTRGRQEYTTVSGDLVLSDVGGDVKIGGVSGDVAVRAEEAITLRANTVSGDLSVIAPRIDESRVVTVSGDVELEADLAATAPHRIETVSGDLSLGIVGGMTLEVRGLSTDVDVNVAHRTEGSRDRRRYVIGDGAANVTFSSMSGDVSVAAARRLGGTFRPVAPPIPPTPPTPANPSGSPTSPTPPAPTAPPLPDEAEQLEILRALERGEIDIETASRRLSGGLTDG